MPRRRATSDTLPFDSMRLEGSLFVPELLERAATGKATKQEAKDYHIPKGLKLHDEYGRAFRIASALWSDFKPQLQRTDLDAAAATQAFVKELFTECLGYTDLKTLDQPIGPDDRGFPISAIALGGRIPVVIAPHNLGLDDPDPRFAIHGSGSRRKSAYQLAQEYLNAESDALWALVTNGRTIRLLRDAETLTRPNYLEFDLQTILNEPEDRYADFSALWRILHVSRAGGAGKPTTDCIWETWKSEGHAQGTRVRDGLRLGVQEALLQMGTHFIAHPHNQALRDRLHNGSLTKDAYFQQLLRLVYRFLFLFCAEERGLLHPPLPEDGAEATKALASRQAYARGYALRRLRSRSLRRSALDRHSDLWLGITAVFRALATGQEKLALPALGGLFATDQCPDLDSASLPNHALLDAMRELRWFTDPKTKQRSAIDYRNMGPEELGSVYESLLELIPTVDLPARVFGFVGITDEGSAAGNTRKTTGSYYTPDSLVKELIKSALDPVIERKIASHPENPTAALLSLSVIDPACGSGHFLISAARRLAEKLAELRAPDGAVRTADYRHALREVIGHCIYGVDRNPMALELARTALWLEGYEPGQPLSFLDHHLQCGDALLGLTGFDQLRKGIAKDAYKALSGDDKVVCKNLAATNREALKALEKRLKDKSAELFDACDLDDALQHLEAIEAMPDGSTAEVEAKKSAFTRFLADAQSSPLAHACDLLVAAYLTPKTPENESLCPTTATLLEVLFPQQGNPAPQAVIDHATERCREARVFHWPLRFAHIFGHGGFDCVLGNPPWEVSQLGEEEYFGAREPNIAALAGAKRKTAIATLEIENPRLWEEYLTDKRLFEASNTFYRTSDRFPLTAVGKLNTYPLFAETIEHIRADSGRAGFIVPTGIATDDSTKAFFSHLISKRRLSSIYDFENRERLFPDVLGHYRLCLMTLATQTSTDAAFFLTNPNQLYGESRSIRCFKLDPEDIRLINPNTLTCPVIRSNFDASLTKKIYRSVPVLVEEARGEEAAKNPWSISFSQGLFNMTSASQVFLDAPEPDSLPLYEAKLIQQFDHRWASYTRNHTGELETVDVTDELKQDPAFHVTPRYWVPEREVLAKIACAPKCVREAFRDQDPDTLIAALAIWIEARYEPDLLGDMTRTTARQRVLQLGGTRFNDLPAKEKDWLTDKALVEARYWPHLTNDELDRIRSSSDLSAVTRTILDQRSPQWLMGWRDITNSANLRTVIVSVVPRSAVGHTMPLFYSSRSSTHLAATLANWNSITLDYIARQKIGGTHLTYGYLKQFPILPPSAYSESDLAFIVPRVLELTYTADDLSAWARDLGHDGPPFRFDPDRRALLRAELDAYYARLYGLTREELQYILDPATTHGPDYPTVTFPGLKKNEIAKHGEYRTQRLVLEAWDRLRESVHEKPTAQTK